MMRYIFFFLLITFASCQHSGKNGLSSFSKPNLSSNVRKYVSHKSDLIALTNASIIDGTGTPIRNNMTVVIEGSIIKEVGKTSDINIPVEATIIDCTGKTLIPGIVGVHNHLHVPGNTFTGELATKLYLAAGVTTIQTCGAASPDLEIELADKIYQGSKIGPDIVTSSPYISGLGGSDAMFIPENEADIAQFIKAWSDKGVKWFKVYRNITPHDLKIVIDEAHRYGAKVTAHLCSVTFKEAITLGIDGIEHGFNSMSDFRNNKSSGKCSGSREYIDTLDIERNVVKDLQQLMIDSGVFMTSTLAIYEASISHRLYADSASLRVMYIDRRKDYLAKTANGLSTAHDNVREHRLMRIMQFEKQFYDMGGLLVAGVDAGRHIIPGFGDLRNYELLIEAGFAAHQAIKIMTSNGAAILEQDSIGSIEENNYANIILLKGNLDQNPQSIHATEIVFKDGYGYDPSLILKELEGQYGNW